MFVVALSGVLLASAGHVVRLSVRARHAVPSSHIRASEAPEKRRIPEPLVEWGMTEELYSKLSHNYRRNFIKLMKRGDEEMARSKITRLRGYLCSDADADATPAAAASVASSAVITPLSTRHRPRLVVSFLNQPTSRQLSAAVCPLA